MAPLKYNNKVPIFVLGETLARVAIYALSVRG